MNTGQITIQAEITTKFLYCKIDQQIKSTKPLFVYKAIWKWHFENMKNAESLLVSKEIRYLVLIWKRKRICSKYKGYTEKIPTFIY